MQMMQDILESVNWRYSASISVLLKFFHYSAGEIMLVISFEKMDLLI